MDIPEIARYRIELDDLHGQFARDEAYGDKPHLNLNRLSVFRCCMRILRDERYDHAKAVKMVADRWEQQLDKIASCSEYREFYHGIIKLLHREKADKIYYRRKLDQLESSEV